MHRRLSFRFIHTAVLGYLLCMAANARPFREADSLKARFSTTASDTMKVRMLLRLSQIFRDTAVVQAIVYATEAGQISQRADWTEGRILAAHATGACYDVVREYSEALNHYRSGLQLAEQSGNQPLQLESLALIAECYNTAGEKDSSLAYKLKTLFLAHRTGNHNAEAGTLTLLGGYYYNLAKYRRAIDYWQQALDVLNILDRPAAVAMLQNNLAGAYMNMSYLDSARERLSEGLLLISTTSDRQTESYLRLTLCDYYTRVQQPAAALQQARLAYDLSGTYGSGAVMQESLRMLATISEDLHQPADALRYYKQYVSVRDSIMHEARTAANARQVLKFNFDQQAAAYRRQQRRLERASAQKSKALISSGIVVVALALVAGIFYYSTLQHRRKNKTITAQAQLLTAQKKAIQASLHEKEILIKEIHHRVKNNLQVISALQQLQSARSSDPQVKAALEDSQNRVLSIAFIHQNLYMHDDMQGVEIRSFVHELADHLMSVCPASDTHIDVRIDVPTLTLDIDTAVPLGLIINELFTNSCKHAFPDREAGRISITLALTAEKGNYLFRYADDGIGLPEGFDPKLNDTLGLKLVTQLSRQIGGEIKYAHHTDACFTLAFKDFDTRNTD